MISPRYCSMLIFFSVSYGRQGSNITLISDQNCESSEPAKMAPSLSFLICKVSALLYGGEIVA